MAVLDSVLVFLVSLLVGAVGIYAGVKLFADDDVSLTSAAITALLGAAAWALVSWLLGGTPVLGALVAFVVWLGVINYRHPGGWPTAAGVALVAWIVSGALLYALALANVVSYGAVGVPT